MGGTHLRAKKSTNLPSGKQRGANSVREDSILPCWTQQAVIEGSSHLSEYDWQVPIQAGSSQSLLTTRTSSSRTGHIEGKDVTCYALANSDYSQRSSAASVPVSLDGDTEIDAEVSFESQGQSHNTMLLPGRCAYYFIWLKSMEWRVWEGCFSTHSLAEKQPCV